MAVGPEAVLSPPQIDVPASFGARVGAHLLDVLVVWFGFASLLVLGAMIPGPVSILFVVAAFVTLLGYQAAMTGLSDGQTVGKRAAGIRVVLEDGGQVGLGRALLRDALVKSVFQVVFVPWLVSVLWALREPHHRALHDHIAATKVIRQRREFVPVAGDDGPEDEWLGVIDPTELDRVTQRALRKQGRLR